MLHKNFQQQITHTQDRDFVRMRFALSPIGLAYRIRLEERQYNYLIFSKNDYLLYEKCKLVEHSAVCAIQNILTLTFMHLFP